MWNLIKFYAFSFVKSLGMFLVFLVISPVLFVLFVVELVFGKYFQKKRIYEFNEIGDCSIGEKPNRKVALLFNANTVQARHGNNIQWVIYNLKKVGYDEIYLFQGRSVVLKFDGVVHLAHEKQVIADKIFELSMRLGYDDQLFVYVTNHGIKLPFAGKKSYLMTSIPFQWISDEVFGGWMEAINCQKFMFFNQCYGWEFANRLGHQPRTIAISTSGRDQVSFVWPTDKYVFGERYSSLFLPYFVGLLGGKLPDGAELNDGKPYSVYLAFVKTAHLVRSNLSRKDFDSLPTLFTTIDTENLFL